MNLERKLKASKNFKFERRKEDSEWVRMINNAHHENRCRSLGLPVPDYDARPVVSVRRRITKAKGRDAQYITTEHSMSNYAYGEQLRKKKEVA